MVVDFVGLGNQFQQGEFFQQGLGQGGVFVDQYYGVEGCQLCGQLVGVVYGVGEDFDVVVVEQMKVVEVVYGILVVVEDGDFYGKFFGIFEGWLLVICVVGVGVYYKVIVGIWYGWCCLCNWGGV